MSSTNSLETSMHESSSSASLNDFMRGLLADRGNSGRSPLSVSLVCDNARLSSLCHRKSDFVLQLSPSSPSSHSKSEEKWSRLQRSGSSDELLAPSSSHKKSEDKWTRLQGSGSSDELLATMLSKKVTTARRPRRNTSADYFQCAGGSLSKQQNASWSSPSNDGGRPGRTTSSSQHPSVKLNQGIASLLPARRSNSLPQTMAPSSKREQQTNKSFTSRESPSAQQQTRKSALRNFAVRPAFASDGSHEDNSTCLPQDDLVKLNGTALKLPSSRSAPLLQAMALAKKRAHQNKKSFGESSQRAIVTESPRSSPTRTGRSSFRNSAARVASDTMLSVPRRKRSPSRNEPSLQSQTANESKLGSHPTGNATWNTVSSYNTTAMTPASSKLNSTLFIPNSVILPTS